jgi:hypothetical protein
MMKLWKVDGVMFEVREVEGTPWPGTDSEGDACYINSHYPTKAAALHKLADECAACLQINARTRAQLQQQIAALNQQDLDAKDAYSDAMRQLLLMRDA